MHAYVNYAKYLRFLFLLCQNESAYRPVFLANWSNKLCLILTSYVFGNFHLLSVSVVGEQQAM